MQKLRMNIQNKCVKMHKKLRKKYNKFSLIVLTNGGKYDIIPTSNADKLTDAQTNR